AIATGFERRYGVLKRLGATPLSRRGLIAAKTATGAVVELAQAVVIIVVGLALGWNPHGGGAAIAGTVLLILAGTASFSGLALLMAGTLRAEATLAAANLVYLVMLGTGGMVFPLSRFPPGTQSVLKLLPAGALSDGLRSVLEHGSGLPAGDLLVLAAWGAAGVALAVRTFRREWRRYRRAAGPSRDRARRGASVGPGADRDRSRSDRRRPGYPAIQPGRAGGRDRTAAVVGRRPAGGGRRQGPVRRAARAGQGAGLAGRRRGGGVRRHARDHELLDLPGVRADTARYRRDDRVPRSAGGGRGDVPAADRLAVGGAGRRWRRAAVSWRHQPGPRRRRAPRRSGPGRRG